MVCNIIVGVNVNRHHIIYTVAVLLYIPACLLCTSSDSTYPRTVVMANPTRYHDAVILQHCSGLITNGIYS